MKRVVVLIIMCLLISACSTKVKVIPAEGAHLSECKDFNIGLVTDQSGYVPGEGEEVFSLKEAMEVALRGAFKESHILNSGSPYEIKTTIKDYKPGNAAARWLFPGAGATVLKVESLVSQNGKDIAIIPIERTIAAGGGYTIGAWKYVFDDVAKALADTLKSAESVSKAEGTVTEQALAK